MADRRRDARDDTLRAFFALALDGGVRRHAERELARLAALPGADAVRWVPAENLHVTLRFLGSVATTAVPDLLARVAARTREIAAFELMLGGVTGLPSLRRAHVVALEAGPESTLQQLAGAIEQGVQDAGFAPEPRPFRPHLTLGRVRRGARLDRSFALAVTGSDTPGCEASPVTEALLFRSDPARGGSIYTSIGHARLQ